MVLKGINYWPKQLSDDMFWLFEIQKTKKTTKKTVLAKMVLKGITYWPKQLSVDKFWLSEVPKQTRKIISFRKMV